MDPTEDMEVTNVDFDQTLVDKIPHDMREAIFHVIETTVAKQVEAQVAKRMEAVTAELQKLREQVEAQPKTATRPGMSRPTTAATAADSRNKPSQASSRIKTVAAARTAASTLANGRKRNESPQTGEKSATKIGSRPTTAASGLKKPTVTSNSFIKPDTSGPSTRSRLGPGAAGGLKPPSDMKSASMRTAEAEPKKAPAVTSKSRTIIGAAAKSADKDELDEIYKNPDPIGVSLDTRRKAGNHLTVVPNKNSKQGKFFFTLKLKGEQAKLSEQPQRKACEPSKPQEESKQQPQQPDPIERSLTSRIKAGSNMTVVPNKEKKTEDVTKLKLVNDLPKPVEIKKEPTIKPQAAKPAPPKVEKVEEEKPVEKVEKVEKPAEEKVFKLGFKGAQPAAEQVEEVKVEVPEEKPSEPEPVVEEKVPEEPKEEPKEIAVPEEQVEVVQEEVVAKEEPVQANQDPNEFGAFTSNPEPVKEVVPEEPTQEPINEPIQEPTQEPVEEPVKEKKEEPEEHVNEPAEEEKDHAEEKEEVNEPIEEPATEPISEPIAEQVSEPEPVVEQHQEPEGSPENEPAEDHKIEKPVEVAQPKPQQVFFDPLGNQEIVRPAQQPAAAPKEESNPEEEEMEF